MTESRECMGGMKSYGKLKSNGDGGTFRRRGTCCVTPWVQGCLCNRDGHVVLLALTMLGQAKWTVLNNINLHASSVCLQTFEDYRGEWVLWNTCACGEHSDQHDLNSFFLTWKDVNMFKYPYLTHAHMYQWYVRYCDYVPFALHFFFPIAVCFCSAHYSASHRNKGQKWTEKERNTPLAWNNS